MGEEPDEDRKGVPWRKNVLALLGTAYASLLGILILLIAVGVDAKEAYNVISVPFVALIGGTLAISKDLLR